MIYRCHTDTSLASRQVTSSHSPVTFSHSVTTHLTNRQILASLLCPVSCRQLRATDCSYYKYHSALTE